LCVRATSVTPGMNVSIRNGVRIHEYAGVGDGASIGHGAAVGATAVIGPRGAIRPNARRFVQRSDGYVFTLGTRDGEQCIWAGCRDFSIEEAREHWND